jgi:alpha-tubulin suppressor-like RCC1 family protein
MPVILSTSNIIIDYGSSNFIIETAKSTLNIDKDTTGSTSNLTAEPIVETVSRMYPPLISRKFDADNYTASTYTVDSMWTEISAGDSHSLFLRSDGRVFACGFNNYGQLGDGTTTNSSTPIPISTTNIGTTYPIIAISAGYAHSLFLRSDGKIFACGYNIDGRFGDGTTTNSSIPIEINRTNIGTSLPITAISAGGSFSLFLRSDGKVFACGWNALGQLGDGTTTNKSTPIEILTTNIGTSLPITAIDAGDAFSLFLRSDGKVFACGYNGNGELGYGTTGNKSTPIAILTTNIGTTLPITAISGGWNHSLFLRSDGKVFACGWNAYGQLGDGTTTSSSTPIAISTTNIGTTFPITAIAGGYYHSLFLRSDGKVFACGYNDNGRLGDGTTTDRLIPIEIDRTNIGTSLPITAIAAGANHSLFIRSYGKVFACGRNSNGTLGDGTVTNKSTPVSITFISFQISLKYGSGLYTVSYSSFTAFFEPFRCFNDTSTPNNEGRWAANNYTSGSYTNTSNLVSGYNGDWLVIKLPISIKLKQFDIKQINMAINRAPKNFRLYGSTNGSSWTLLVDKQNTTYTSLLYTHTDMSQYSSATEQYYNHFGLVVNTLVGNTETTLSFDEFFIYGVEQVTPLTITLNSTNKSLRIPTLTSDNYPNSDLNYNLKFPTPTFVNNISTSSNIILQGDYNVNILSSTSSTITPIGGQTNIPIVQTLSLPTSNITLNYHLLNPIKEPAQWTYSHNNSNVYHLGNVGIGTKTASYPLHVNGNMFVSSTAYTGSGQTTWTTVSDRRIKENIVKASYEKCLENVKNIELYRFNFKNNVVNTNDYNQLGFIAQEVQSVYPKAVEVNMIKDKTGEIPDLLSLNTTQIDYTLYGAVKELIKKVEILEKKLEENENSSNMMLSSDVPEESSSNIVVPPIYPDDYLMMMIPPHLRMEHMMRNEYSSNITPLPISREEYLRNLMMLPPHLHKTYEDYLRKLMMYPEVPEEPAVSEVSNESTSNIIVSNESSSNIIVSNESSSNIISNNSNIIEEI